MSDLPPDPFVGIEMLRAFLADALERQEPHVRDQLEAGIAAGRMTVDTARAEDGRPYFVFAVDGHRLLAVPCADVGVHVQ
jgi:hypothetical protein